jgi:colanic acid biosynthesis glycosyl transferase WcaI
MKILFLCQFFTPEPDFKGLPFALELARRGHQVEVLTGFPNYPGGKVYPGYKIRPFQRETIQGIRVNRVPLYPSHSTSAVGRVLNYASFAISASVLGPLAISRADVAYVYHPPATIGLPASVISALRGVPFVYDVQDLWPDTLASTGMLSNPRILRAIDAWCSFVYRRAAHVTVLSPGFRRALLSRGVSEDKVTVIPNWCNEAGSATVPFDESVARDTGMFGRFNILFAGTMGKAQDLDTVLDAARLCADRNPAIQFVFVGGGIERARLELQSRGASNVLFLPARPASEMAPLLSMSQVLLVHLKDDPLFEITIPSKTQAYMAAGKPILMAVRGDAADMVSAAGAGVVSPPGNSTLLAEAALSLAGMDSGRLESMGAAGREYYFRELSFSRGVSRFEELFVRVAESR